MKAELGDKVTLTGLVAQRFYPPSGSDTLEILLNDDRRIRLPADYEFTSVQKAPYRPKVGHWVTWSAGMVGYECLWVTGGPEEGGYMLARMHGWDKPQVWPFEELRNLRRCGGPRGDKDLVTS
jgi:hypothetical protein